MPGDGEPVVPCAQGRVVIETVRPAPPHFATCSTYRKQLANKSEAARIKKAKTLNDNKNSKGTTAKTTTTVTLTITTATTTASSIVTRPENLKIKSCFSNTPTAASQSLTEKQSSHPLLKFDDNSINAELMSTQNSSVESDPLKIGTNIQRKAYMDLRDAIALLDETCPNPNASPSVTPKSPRTPRTPLTPHPRSKRARSKSSDNSSNYSNDRLSEKSFENTKVLEKSKKRPFLRKLGISMTDERPFFAKLAPKIIGKPYLEKIGPSKAVEKPYLDKIGSSRTLDKFTFEWPKCDTPSEKIIEENEKLETTDVTVDSKTFSKRSGKGFLCKMYSFETEDLEDNSMKKHHRDPLRGASLDDVIDTGSTSLASIQNVEHTKQPCTAKLVKCKVTMSEEVLSSNTCLSSSVEGPMWENSPRRKRKTKNFLAQMITKSDTVSSKKGLRSDESVPNSPTKRRLNVDNASSSPAKSRRQISEDILDKKMERHKDLNRYAVSSDNLFTVRNKIPASVKTDDDNNSQDVSRSNHNYNKETFKQLYNRFESQEVPTESYAEFKQRTQKNIYSTSALRRVPDVNKISLPSLNFESSFQQIKLVYDEQSNSTSNSAKSEFLQIRSRSVLRKQEGIDHTSDQECDTNTTPNRPKKRILFHQPSQETVDLLTELRRVKSLLKTPSFEKDLDLDEIKDIVKLPKKVQLTDKEFCLSVERENSIRRPTATGTQVVTINDNVPIALSPSFFNEQCLSIEYADDDRSPKADTRTISLSSTKCRPSEVEETTDLTPICDSQSYSSDVFSSPSGDEAKQQDVLLTVDKLQHYDVDISIPVNEKGCSSESKIHLQSQAKTTDQYEIMSPRVTPFKLKKRLGKISVEDTMKHEKFALNKANCRSVAVQKKTRCFPL